MPLVVITGYPSSGKSRISQSLHDSLSRSKENDEIPLNIHHVMNENLGLNPSEFLKNSTEEKKARATFMGAITRKLTRESIVIADSLNYTKSERYQLYCVAREYNTTYCVIHVATPVDQCAEWNADKISGALFTEMVQRYEMPSHTHRWDNPLFTLLHFDDIPLEDVMNSILKKDRLKSTLATVTNTPSNSNYLYLLDKTIQAIISDLIEKQKNGFVIFEGVEFVSLAELSRHKRKFISMQEKLRYSTKNQQSMSNEQITSSFNEFLKVNLKQT